MSPPVLGSCSLPETPPEVSLSQCSLLIPRKKLRVSLPGPWSPLGLLLGLGRPPGRASGVHLVQPEVLCLLWCPLLPEKPGVSGRGGGGSPAPYHSPEALCMVPRWEVSHGKRALGKNGPDLQRRRRARRLGLSPHGGIGQSGWGGVLCGWHRVWELHPGMFSKRSDGGIPTRFQDFILPPLELGWGERWAAEWTLWALGAGSWGLNPGPPLSGLDQLSFRDPGS